MSQVRKTFFAETQMYIRNGRRNIDAVLPLEFCPHAPELCLVTVRRFDVVHDVDMDIVQHDA